MVNPNPPQALLKVTLKKIPTLELEFSFLVGPPGLEPETKGLCLPLQFSLPVSSL